LNTSCPYVSSSIQCLLPTQFKLIQHVKYIFTILFCVYFVFIWDCKISTTMFSIRSAKFGRIKMKIFNCNNTKTDNTNLIVWEQMLLSSETYLKTSKQNNITGMSMICHTIHKKRCLSCKDHVAFKYWRVRTNHELFVHSCLFPNMLYPFPQHFFKSSQFLP